MLTNVWPGPVSSLTGIQFGDNKSQKYVTEENGVALAITQVLKNLWNKFLKNQLKISNQLTICAWIYPQWSRWNAWIGIFEITTPEAILSKADTISGYLRVENGTLDIWAKGVHSFPFNISFPNILRCILYLVLYSSFWLYNCRKWNRLCFSYDFQKNQAQVAFSGKVSELIIDPDTGQNMNGGEEEFVSEIFSGFNVFYAREVR